MDLWKMLLEGVDQMYLAQDMDRYKPPGSRLSVHRKRFENELTDPVRFKHENKGKIIYFLFFSVSRANPVDTPAPRLCVNLWGFGLNRHRTFKINNLKKLTVKI